MCARYAVSDYVNSVSIVHHLLVPPFVHLVKVCAHCQLQYV
jgi:hypothetical protein